MHSGVWSAPTSSSITWARWTCRLGCPVRSTCGRTRISGQRQEAGAMLVMAPGPAGFTALEPSAVILLGGEELGERFLYWNFVSSSKERIEQVKADWKAGRMKLPDLDCNEFIPLPEELAPSPNPMS